MNAKGYLYVSLFSKMDAIHDFAREGEEENLLKCIENGVPVNLKGLSSYASPLLFFFFGLFNGSLSSLTNQALLLRKKACFLCS